VSPGVEEALAQCSPAALAAYRQSAGAA
jgi:hypothetical protein